MSETLNFDGLAQMVWNAGYEKVLPVAVELIQSGVTEEDFHEKLVSTIDALSEGMVSAFSTEDVHSVTPDILRGMRLDFIADEVGFTRYIKPNMTGKFRLEIIKSFLMTGLLVSAGQMINSMSKEAAGDEEEPVHTEDNESEITAIPE